MDAFPDEIFRIIFTLVGPLTLCRASRVSKKFRFLADEDAPWKNSLGLSKSRIKKDYHRAAGIVLIATINEGHARAALRLAEAELRHQCIRLCESKFDTIGFRTTQKWQGRMETFANMESAMESWSTWPHLRNEIGIDRVAGELNVLKSRLELYTDDLIKIDKLLVK